MNRVVACLLGNVRRTLHFQRSSAAALSALLMTGLLLNGQPAHASHKIYSPTVEQGEYELELRAHRSLDSDASKDDQQKIKLEAGYGVSDKWFTAIGGEMEKDSGGDLDYTSTYWENIIQLTEQGEYWVDVGVYLEYNVGSKAGSTDELEGKLLLEKCVGSFVHTANLVLVRNLGPGASNATNFEYAWRSKYFVSKALEVGVEIYGETGEIGHATPSDQQDHRLGPVISGELGHTGKGKWEYELGYLFGVSDAAPDGTIKLNLEYEFR
jgi:hypothetical protein